jgi:hypothetical protein
VTSRFLCFLGFGRNSRQNCRLFSQRKIRQKNSGKITVEIFIADFGRNFYPTFLCKNLKVEDEIVIDRYNVRQKFLKRSAKLKKHV